MFYHLSCRARWPLESPRSATRPAKGAPWKCWTSRRHTRSHKCTDAAWPRSACIWWYHRKRHCSRWSVSGLLERWRSKTCGLVENRATQNENSRPATESSTLVCLLWASNLRIIVSMNVFWGATWPLLTGILADCRCRFDAGIRRQCLNPSRLVSSRFID